MKTCVLCGKLSDTVESFTITDDARALLQEQYPFGNPDEFLSQTGVCRDCMNLPASERKALADKAIREALDEVRRKGISSRREKGEGKENRFTIDIAKTIEQVPVSPEVAEWLDLLGDVVIITQKQAIRNDEFAANTPFRKLLVAAIHRDISSLNAIYLLLRCEWIHQAAAHVRLFCESAITLSFIAQDLDIRVHQFLEYEHVEAYEVTQSVLEIESARANPKHVEQVKALLRQIEPEYLRVKPKYVVVGRKGRRPFINWCNISIAAQARLCGERLVRLYRIVYSQLSAYVHGSSWSLRRQWAYSRRGYSSHFVLVDTVTVVRTTLVVWEEWARFCDKHAGWNLTPELSNLVERMNELETKLQDRL